MWRRLGVPGILVQVMPEKVPRSQGEGPSQAGVVLKNREMPPSPAFPAGIRQPDSISLLCAWALRKMILCCPGSDSGVRKPPPCGCQAIDGDFSHM